MDKSRQTTIVIAIIGFLGVLIAIGSSVLSSWLGVQSANSPSSDFTTTIISAAATVIVGLLGLIAAIYGTREARKEADKEKQRIAEAASKVERQPEKARPAWDLARVTLDSYFNRNLSQSTYIFWLSVFVMFIGFSIIVWGIVQAINVPTIITPAAISVLAGIVTEFLGATFIFLYRSTIQQALNYAQALERINAVGMAMQILDTMPDETKEGDLKSKTKAVLVELLVRQAHEVSSGFQKEAKE